MHRKKILNRNNAANRNKKICTKNKCLMSDSSWEESNYSLQLASCVLITWLHLLAT